MSVEEKKIGEVIRLQQLMDDKALSFEDIAALSGASVRTAKNIVYENKPLGMKLIRGLAETTGVSIDWLLIGEGSMYRADNGGVQKDDGSDVHYRVTVKNSKGVANVVNNHGVNNGNIVAQGGTDRTEQGGNEQLLINFITWFMKNHDATDQAWLVGQLARSVPEFKEWRDNPPE